MKKAAIILLTVFILLQSGILSLQHVVKLMQHKTIVQKSIEKGLFNSRFISFNAIEMSGAKWENNYEFFLNGEKYDVVKMALNDSNIEYICINDKDEKILINNIEKSENKSNLIEELIKKINLQINDFGAFTIANRNVENIASISYLDNLYSFLFIGFINKPPIH